MSEALLAGIFGLVAGAFVTYVILFQNALWLLKNRLKADKSQIDYFTKENQDLVEGISELAFGLVAPMLPKKREVKK